MDWPPEGRGRSRLPPDEASFDLHVRVTRNRGTSVLLTIFKVIAGAVCGLVIVASAWLIVTILQS